MTAVECEQQQQGPSLEAAEAAARQAYLWSAALASPGRRRIGPNLIPCRANRTPLRKWAEDHPPGYEQCLADALRSARNPDPKWRAATWSIAPASDGLVVVDVDDMELLPRVLAVFGPSPVIMRSRNSKVHLYFAGPPVESRTHLWGKNTIDVKCEAMIHVAGDGARPAVHVLRESGPMGWLRPSLPPFRVDVYKGILEKQREARPSRSCPDDRPDQFATTPSEVERVRRYIERAGQASEGERHDRTFYLLRNIGDIGASEELALELVLEWDAENVKPQGEHEIRRAARDAYTTRREPIGWRMRGGDDGEQDNAAASLDDYREELAWLRAM